MTYAYDDWVLLPTKDLYDTLTMAMAINVAKDMYDRGQEAIKDFNKTYGDFMSPFSKDIERYGEMMGTVRNMINDAYSRGIDLTKSAEGRALIQRAINTVNPAEYNNMRANAKVGYAYLDAIQKAKEKGMFDQDYENWLLQNGGPGLFNDFSSANGATWNRPAPGQFQDINSWTHHLFDNMELSYDPELSKQYPGFMAYSKSRDTMNQIINNNIAGLLNTDLGRYRLNQLKNSGLSDEQAIEALKTMVVNSNLEQSRIKLEQDPIYMAQLSANLQRQTHAENAAIDNYYKMQQILAAKNNPDEQTTSLPTPLDRLIKYNVDEKVKDTMGIGKDSDPRTRVENVKKIVSYYQSLMDYIAKEKGRRVEDGFEEIEEKSLIPITTSGAMMPGQTSQYRTSKKKVPKYKYVYDGKDDKLYQKYKEKVEYYKNHQDGFYDPLNKKERDRLNQLNNISKTRQLTDHEQKAYKVLSEKERISYENQRKAYINDYNKASSNRLAAGPQFAKANDEFYGKFEFQPQDEAGIKTAISMFTGNTQPREISGFRGKYSVVDFSQPGIKYAPIRKSEVSGPRRYTDDSLQGRFGKFLKSCEGVMFNTNARFASIPKEYSQLGSTQTDIIASPSISREDFIRFYNSLPNDVKKQGYPGIARQLGLSPRKVGTTILNEDKNAFLQADYYDVPAIRTTNNYAFENAQMNNQYNIYNFGQSKAFDMAPNSEASSLTPYIIQD